MIDIQEDEYIITFQCYCGCESFERPKELLSMRLVSFYEGYFECSECKEYHDYTSDCFSTELKNKNHYLFN
jgi:hypothetical protein